MLDEAICHADRTALSGFLAAQKRRTEEKDKNGLFYSSRSSLFQEPPVCR